MVTRKLIKFKTLIILGIIFGAFLRLWKLGQNPPSLFWDEAALGYNAYSLLKTGRDEWGARLPLSLRSFNDYKPPLYAYLTVPFVHFFGLTPLAVRLPSALAGIATLVTLPFLVGKLFSWMELDREKKLGWWVAGLSTWLLSISPWHLQFSRGAFEANLALFLFTAGATLFLWSDSVAWFMPLSALVFGASLYAYHAPRLLIPAWLLVGAVFFRKEVTKKRKIGTFLVVLLLSVLPLLRVAQYGGLGSRWQAVKIAAGETGMTQRGGILNSPYVEFGRSFISGYLAHFNPQFLVIDAGATRDDPVARHHAVDTGVMLWASLPFLAYGLYRLVGMKGKGRDLILAWFLLGPLPAGLTREAPHAIRSLLTLPALQIITALGLVLAIESFSRWRNLLKAFLVILFAGNFLIYLHNYYVHTPKEWSQYWQYGYREMVEETMGLAKNYERVVVTKKYDQPYIFFLFYGKVDPAWYQKNGIQEGFGPYQFRNINLDQEDKQNTLFVVAPDEVGEQGRVLKKIYFLDGSEAFRLLDFPNTSSRS